jgi:uncharacterized protein YcbK (DUF882 family)
MNSESKANKALTRRRVLKSGAIAAAAILIPGVAAAEEWIRLPEAPAKPQVTRAGFLVPNRRSDRPRALSFYNVHTGESLNAVYFEDGNYVPGALTEVNYFFRDFRANEIKSIDPNLLDLLHDIHGELDTSKPFNLVSGYRSPATNAWLAARSEGVARHSMHLEGRAADINIPGRQLSFLQRIALALRLGGVGYYPQSGFVHVDTGRVRRWGARS